MYIMDIKHLILKFYEVNFVLLNSTKLAYVSQHSNVYKDVIIKY